VATETGYGGEDNSKGNGGKGGTAMARAGASAARMTSRARVGVMRRQQIVILQLLLKKFSFVRGRLKLPSKNDDFRL
jgi:hypothetical protein